jgi:hypothetical protein
VEEGRGKFLGPLATCSDGAVSLWLSAGHG